MRTTIEMRDEHRAKLLELAARRGEKGFSRLVEEALEVYLKAEKEAGRKRAAALKAIGSVSTEEAERMRGEIRRLRASWR